MAEAENNEERLFLPCEDAEEWARVEALLRRPLQTPAALDALLTDLSPPSRAQTCRFFARVPGSADAAGFDFPAFFAAGLPLMVAVALEMPALFPAGARVPLLLVRGKNRCVALTRRQCACLLAHSAFGSITASARRVRKEKWAFCAAQLFFLEATPSALCFLNYFKQLGLNGIPEGTVTFERVGFEKGAPPWKWDSCETRLCPVEIVPQGTIETSPADTHADFANRFVGGGALENDFMMEEILFAIKPELIVAMALASFLHDEEGLIISGALQFSLYSGYASTFQFEGDYDGRRPGPPPRVAAMDALQGFARVQFNEGFVLRDLNKARVAFSGAREIATGNWGCGAFGNDHVLKFIQQWLAASEAGVAKMYYHTFSDKRISELPALVSGLSSLTVGQLYSVLMSAAKLGTAAQFRRAILAHATETQV